MSAPSEIASLKDRIKELEDELTKVRTQLKFAAGLESVMKEEK